MFFLGKAVIHSAESLHGARLLVANSGLARVVAVAITLGQGACSRVDESWSNAATEVPSEILEHGRMVVSLSHTGQESIADRLSSIVGRADFTVERVVVDEHPLIAEEQHLETVSVVGVVLDEDGLLPPSRSITIAGTDGKTWRFDYAVKLGQTDITPPMRDLLGHTIRLYVRRETWGVTPFYGALITDERGLVLALDSGALDATQYPNLTITQGPRIEVAGAEGGVSRLQRFTFPDGPRLLLAPGQCQTVRVDDGLRTTCSLWCTYWHDDHVTDVVNEITWASWLARDDK